MWQAQRVDAEDSVALKVLWEHLAEDAAARAAFVREAAILAEQALPGVVRVHEVVREGQRPALVMDLSEGQDLRALLVAQAPLPPARACRIAAQVASALAGAHAAGLVHRDLKPENIVVDDRDGRLQATVTDFGLARQVASHTVTKASGLVGTVDYLAPEVIEGNRASAAADVYALGVILYESLAGRRPFRGPHEGAVLGQHLRGVLHRPQGLGDALWQLLQDLLQRTPDQRPTAADVAHRLTELAQQSAGAPALDRREPPAPVLADEGRTTTQVVSTRAVGDGSPAGAGVRKHPRRALALVGVVVLLVAALVADAGLRPDSVLARAAAWVTGTDGGTDSGGPTSPAPSATGAASPSPASPSSTPAVTVTATATAEPTGPGTTQEESPPPPATTPAPSPAPAEEPDPTRSVDGPDPVVPEEPDQPEPSAQPPATQAPCPGAGCQGLSATSAGCSDDGRVIDTEPITASTGGVAGHVKIFWSARCSSAYATLQVAVRSPLRARLSLVEDGATVDVDDSTGTPTKYLSTLMAHLEPGDCVTATGLLGHSGDSGYYPEETASYCR